MSGLRRLLIRFVLWTNNYCPEHGPKRGTLHCFMCTHRKYENHQNKLASYAKEVNR